MHEFLQLAALPLLLTMCAYQIGLLCQRRFKSPVCNPILIAVVLVLAFFALTGLSNETYQNGVSTISWLTTPATICLAIPMYEHFQVLKKNILAILAGVCAGAVSCLVTVLLFALFFGFDHALTISLLPKSIRHRRAAEYPFRRTGLSHHGQHHLHRHLCQYDGAGILQGFPAD